MDLVAHLEKVLNHYQNNPPTEELRLQGWRFAVNDYTVIKAGIRDNKLGEVYAAPALNKSYAGDLLLIWPGDYCSHTVVNSTVVSGLEQKLPIWKQGAYKDPHGSVLLDPEPLALASVEHREVMRMVKDDPKPLFSLLNRYRQELPARGINSVQGGVQAGWGERHIRTSKGLSVTYSQTSFSTYISADGLFSKGFAKRRPPTDAETTRLIAAVSEITNSLKTEAKLQPGVMDVIFAPELVNEFIGKYLLTNLSGNNVVNNQGAYTLADFTHQRQVFDRRISINVNPLKPFELSSYLCTREGLPARAQALVSEGKLLTPYLTVKDSMKAGMKPTPLPQSGGLWLEVEKAGSMEQLIAGTDCGILVYSVLGLHTQDSSSGAYSLLGPHCLKIEAGKIVGRVEAVIAGNFLAHLKDPATQYGLNPGEDTPAMKFKAQVR